MRIWFSGPRIFGIRPGISLSAQELGFGRSQARQSVPAVQGFIYVVSGDHGRCKIGITRNPAARIGSLRTASAFPLRYAFIGAVRDSAFAVEQEALRLLAGNKVEGEWFDVAPEMAIAAVWGAAGKLGDKIEGLSERDAARTVALVQAGDRPRLTLGRVLAYALWYVVSAIVAVLFGLMVYAIVDLAIVALKA